MQTDTFDTQQQGKVTCRLVPAIVFTREVEVKIEDGETEPKDQKTETQYRRIVQRVMEIRQEGATPRSMNVGRLHREINNMLKSEAFQNMQADGISMPQRPTFRTDQSIVDNETGEKSIGIEDPRCTLNFDLDVTGEDEQAIQAAEDRLNESLVSYMPRLEKVLNQKLSEPEQHVERQVTHVADSQTFLDRMLRLAAGEDLRIGADGNPLQR